MIIQRDLTFFHFRSWESVLASKALLLLPVRHPVRSVNAIFEHNLRILGGVIVSFLRLPSPKPKERVKKKWKVKTSRKFLSWNTMHFPNNWAENLLKQYVPWKTLIYTVCPICLFNVANNEVKIRLENKIDKSFLAGHKYIPVNSQPHCLTCWQNTHGKVKQSRV